MNDIPENDKAIAYQEESEKYCEDSSSDWPFEALSVIVEFCAEFSHRNQSQ